MCPLPTPKTLEARSRGVSEQRPHRFKESVKLPGPLVIHLWPTLFTFLMIETKTPSGKARWSLEFCGAPSQVRPLPSRPCRQRWSHQWCLYRGRDRGWRRGRKVSALLSDDQAHLPKVMGVVRGESGVYNQFCFWGFPAFRCVWVHGQHLLDEAATVAHAWWGTWPRMEGRFTLGRALSLHCLVFSSRGKLLLFKLA